VANFIAGIRHVVPGLKRDGSAMITGDTQRLERQRGGSANSNEPVVRRVTPANPGDRP
jgi:hypothetical protein